MTIQKRTSLIFSLMLITVIQFVNTSCSKKLFRDSGSRSNQLMSHQDSRSDNPGNEEKSIAEESSNNIRTNIESEQKNTVDSSHCGINQNSLLHVSQTCGDEIIITALKYIGTPYCMGGLGRKCIDCSGLVLKVFAEFGINLPHNAQAQSKQGTIIRSRNDLAKGDVVFFRSSYKTTYTITHAGIYDGNNLFVHASRKGVTVTSMDDPWWKKKFAFGTRIL